MKTHRKILVPAGVLAAIVLFGPFLRVEARESLIAIGNTQPGGGLDKSANTVNGVVACVKNAVGEYDLTVSATGVFAGDLAADFLVETTVEATSSGDIVANAAVTAVTANLLTIRLRTSDIEESGNANTATAADAAVNFAIRRVNSLSSRTEGDTRFLLATGRVADTGTLESGFGVGGRQVTSARLGTGNYTVTLTKTGAFAGDLSDDYVIFLSVIGGGAQDRVIRGDLSNSGSDNNVFFSIRTDDAQAAVAANDPLPADSDFAFSIFHLGGSDATGAPLSRLNDALINVDGATGNLVYGTSVFGGGVVSSTQTGVGRYTVKVNAAGAFAGVPDTRYVPMVYVQSPGLADEFAIATLSITNNSTLEVAVATNDLQTGTQASGVAADRSFFLVLVDTQPDAVLDLSIGTRRNRNSFKGGGIQNVGGARQGIRLSLNGIIAKLVFFDAANEGDVIDDFKIKGRNIAGPLRTNFMRKTGGVANVTARVKTGGVVATGVRPGNSVSFEGKFAYKRGSRTPNRVVKLLGSTVSSAAADTIKVNVAPR